MSKTVVYNENRKQFALEDSIPIGTNRQVLGYVNGEPTAVTLGWMEFSDLETPPSFDTGVLSGTTFNPDGSAMYYFHELNNAVGALAKENAIPVYGADGVLKVADGVDDNDAVSMQQFNALIERVIALETP